MATKPTKADPDPSLATFISAGKVVLQSLAFGLLFIPITIGVLLGKAVVDWWRFDDWSTSWIWTRGGYAFVGMFAITSASFFLHKVTPCRFVLALIVVVGGMIALAVVVSVVQITPPRSKQAEVHWYDPDVLAQSLLTPWFVAAAVFLWQKALDVVDPRIS